MSYIQFALGMLLTVLAVFDLIYTVLSPNGSGLITGKFTRWSWRFILFISGKSGKASILNHAGVIITFSQIILWVILIWLGNTILFYSDSKSLIDPLKNLYVVSFTDKLYYSGYVLSSMGSGEYSPVGDWWKFYVGLISYTGVIYMSLSISFLIPVVEGVTKKRLLAVQIAEIGLNPKDMISRHYHNNCFDSFIERAYDLRTSIVELGQTHLAYPIIHYFHSSKKYESLSVNLVALDEAISILKNSLPDATIGQTIKLDEVRMSITFYLAALKIAYIEPEDDEPEVPQTSYYFENLPLNNHQNISSKYENIRQRRKLLLAYLQNDGWTWEDMETADDHVTISPN
jgi:hypothetical protein